jgi:hypothetical protein
MRILRFGLAALIGLFSFAAMPARADVYTFTVDTCGGGCGSIGTGTVTVTQDAQVGGVDTVKVVVAFSNNLAWGFVDTGAGQGNSFFFNLINSPTIAVEFGSTGWKLVSPTAGDVGHAGNGSLTGFQYALSCNYTGGACPGSGGSTPAPPPLIFDVTAAGLTPGSFDKLDTKGDADFAADVKVLSGTGSGNTGLIGATFSGGGDQQGTVPEPASIVLLGGIMVATLRTFRHRVA